MPGFVCRLEAKEATHLNGVVHRQTGSRLLEVKDLQSPLLSSIVGRIYEFELAGLRHDDVRRTVLIAVGMSTDDDGFRPPRNRLRDLLDHDRFAEDGAAEDVTDRAARDQLEGQDGQNRSHPFGDLSVKVSKSHPHTYEKSGTDLYIFLSLNSTTRASSGVIVAHLTATPYLRPASVFAPRTG